MLSTLACWLVLSIVFFAVGWFGRKVVAFVCKVDFAKGMDEIVVLGVVLVGLYAETASLFRGLDCISAGIPVVAAAAIFWFWRKEISTCVRGTLQTIFHTPAGVVFLVVSGFLVCYETYLSGMPAHYFDTGNYHLPSIRWIEEYGVVKGLGNLHTRLAYNSSSLCLHALFAFTWLVGRPLAALNGFLWLFAVVFCLWGLVRDARKGMCLASVFRLQLLCLVLPRAGSVTAPNTDFMPLVLTGFVFVKWCEYTERVPRPSEAFAWLAVVAVFTVSVKLSAAALMLFPVFSLWRMLYNRSWKSCWALGFAVALVLAPFLTRNVLLSGYLLYPFPSLDVFAVDWKVPPTVALSDAISIQLYARMPGAWNYLQAMDPFRVWFPRWWTGLSLFHKTVFLAGGLGHAVGVAAVLRGGGADGGRSGFREVSAVAAGGFVFLLAGAPSFRFGDWWIVSGAALGSLAIWRVISPGLPVYLRECVVRSSAPLAAWICVCGVPLLLAGMLQLPEMPGNIRAHWLLPAETGEETSTSAWADLDGRRFYYHKRTSLDGSPEGGTNGYRGFPGTECRTTLERIEMRGPTLADGFRPRPAFKDAAYDFQGKLLDEDELRALAGTGAGMKLSSKPPGRETTGGTERICP